MLLTEQQYRDAGFTDEEINQRKNRYKMVGFSDEEINKAFGIQKPSIPISTARERGTMANIPPLTPQQELAPATLTPEEQGQTKKEVLSFLKGQVDPKNIIRGITPALGMGGATAGSFFGPWGTALGYAGGQRIGREIETLTGVSKPETLPKALVETGKDIGLGLLPYGIQKTAGAISKVPEILTKPWTTGGKVKEIFKTVGGKLEPSLAGESGVGGAKQVYTAVSKKGNQLYESWKELFPKETKTQLSNLYSSVDNILTDPASTNAEKALANKMLDRISFGTRRGGLTPEQQLGVMQRAEETGQIGIMLKPSTIEEAYTTRSMLSAETKKGGKAGWRAGQMMDSLHQDLTETAERLGNPDIIKEGQKAINFWRDKVIPQREVVKLLEKKSFEKIPDLLKTDIRTVEKIRGGMPEEEFQDLKRGFATDVSNKVEGNPRKVGQEFRKLLSTKKEVMQSVFNEEELEAIRISSDPGKLGKYFEEHPNAKWLAKFIGYGLAYGTIGYAGMKRIFGFSPH